MSEVLLVLHKNNSHALKTLKTQFKVTHVGSLRVAVVEVHKDQLPSLQSLEDIEGVYTAMVPPAVANTMTLNERLVAEAWQNRIKGSTETRMADNLAWDAESFNPPDGLKHKV